MDGLDLRAKRSLMLVAIGSLLIACDAGSPTSGPSGGTDAAGPAASATTSLGPSVEPSETGRPFDPTVVSLSVDVVVDGLAQPIDLAAPGDGSGRMFVVEQAGRIRVVADGELRSEPMLDIRSRIASGGERGLLGLALHPTFPTDPRLFGNYTDVNGDTVVAEYQLDAEDPNLADADSERILIHFEQPYPNHNGVGMVFGPDGMLYVATGDGGSAGDPHDNGRRLDTLLAKVLRIDVDGPRGPGEAPYRIPVDNPFADVAGAMPEVWLTGLRNPWRIRFDDATGDLWIGDVGQGAWEEIDVAPAGSGGLDFGWSVMEGFHCNQPRDGCDQSGLTLPVAEYGHDLGCAVIGGVVVRDPDQPLLNGGYLFSDSCSGNLWLLDTGGSGRREATMIRETGRSISSIALDADGRVVATDRGAGELVRISAAAR